MERGPNQEFGSRGATVLISLTVREGREDDYRRWQQKVDQAAGGFSGFEAAEQYPPTSDEQNSWSVVFRFSTIDQLTAWLNSAERQELLAEGDDLFEGAATQEILAGEPPTRDVVTAVVSHDVRPGRERDFRHWQNKVRKVQEKSPGFMGLELFEPVPGVQEKWVAVFRYDSRAHLDEWLESETRAKLLEEGEDYFAGYDVRKIRSAFGSWFRFDGEGEEGIPSNWKQAMTVLLALYPTVMVLSLTVGRELGAAGLPGYLSLFIGNVLSVSILTWLLMPLVNKIFAFWLVPGPARVAVTNLAGAAAIVACYLLLLAIFAWVAA
ncbi:antibiotic biosynthesis monooxygenase [Saccharopolyspora sp. NPDC002686]|uniref:antibiotic biosynthesis monooxygenase n=1 Tax=Saccharopolyspora sp. NPDC002686 TaxID=3154541 RepID=UPI00331C004B